MTTWIGLLRAVNLGSHNKVSMAELRDLLGGLGLIQPRTLLQSGNIVFDSDQRSAARLETRLEDAVREHLGLDTAILLRSAAEWQAMIDHNPFAAAARDDPGHLLLLTLCDEPDADAVAALRDAIRGREQVHVAGRHAWIVYPDGIGRSKLTTALIEKKLGTVATGRNWNTVLKLAALAAQTED